MSLRRFARIVLTLSAVAGASAAFATGCADDESLVGGSCAPGYAQCGLRCVDLETDPDHCGSCDHACAPATLCVSGACGDLADGPTGPFGDATADATTDANSSNGEASPGDESTESSGDAAGSDATLAGDTANGDGASGDATVVDASVIDSSLVDASVIDSSLVDASVSDGPAIEASGPNEASEGDDTGPDGGTGADAQEQDAGAIDATEVEAGGCPPGVYDTAQACGDCVTVCAGATPLCSPTDGGFACTALCGSPLMDCGGQCVDPTSDSSNCGGCANVCTSQICQNSQCVGATTGGIVFIGHDFETTAPGTTQARVLSNAVFIPQTNPLRVLSYERYADAVAVSRITTILNGVARQLGRTLNLTETINDADIPNTLSLQNFDVLLVPDQPTAPAGALGALGPGGGGNWGVVLASFAQSGGVVVVLDGGTGVGEMPAFVTGTGLLTITAQAPVAVGTQLQDVARADVEGIGLVSPYAAGANSVSVTTEAAGGDVVYVVVDSNDAGVGPPVVVHKVF